jgi:uncharacterized protein YjdB
MNVRYLVRTLVSFAASSVILVTGCRDSGPVQPVDPAIQVEEASIFLTVGQSRTLAVNVAPANTPWTAESDDPETAAVASAPGSVTITGVRAGFATVHLTLTQYPWVWLQVAVEVTSQ